MEQASPSQQNYNAGIIFLSYVIAVIGALTTLELLQRRTHIRGYYNWFLLFAAAASMGGVGIWSMHFIGNNSLTIILVNGEPHQLSYATGFTFASLIVAITTMFLAFAFVGITEEAKIGRIIPSGVIAGMGIASMHYLGQLAIDFFIMKNRLAYVIGAVIIAVCAVTVALLIFFKLREQWANQWYKRLGCAMLMGVAVCGMHYTALVGTVYYPGNSDSGPPTPLLGTSALIGIIAAVVVSACIILIIIGAKNQLESNASIFQSKSARPYKRLILDTIFFDTNGRILVKVDGVVPMKELLCEIPEEETHESFTTSHPLFSRLFEITIEWAAKSSNVSSTIASLNDEFSSQTTLIRSVEREFLTAANELVEELRFSQLSDLGQLFDSILHTNMIPKKSLFSKDALKKPNVKRSISTNSSSRMLSSTNLFHKKSTLSINESIYTDTRKSTCSPPMSSAASLRSQTGNATVIDIFDDSRPSKAFESSKLAVRDSDTEDRHIFLVKKIDANKDLVNLLSIGFRFAEPAFISKTMGEKLRIPSDYMLNYFKDMLQMAETSATMYTPVLPSTDSIYTSHLKQHHHDAVKGGVFVGLFTLIEDGKNGKMPYVIVEKRKRYTFPMVQLEMEGETEAERKPTELSREEKDVILRMSGQTLANVALIPGTPREDCTPDASVNSANYLIHRQQEEEHDEASALIQHTDVKTQKFKQAFCQAANTLIRSTHYGKPLASSAKLYGDVVDVPAFSLRSGPCQLILFRAHISTPGTRFAINSTLTETVKCIPFPMYRSYAFFVTDVAVERYRADMNQTKSPSKYLTQQRLYQNTAARNKHHESVEEVKNDLNLLEKGSTAMTVYTTSSTKEEDTEQQSLPPPPRAKRNKFTFPAGLSPLDVNGIVPNMLKGGKMPPRSPGFSIHIKVPVTISLLPAGDRFWWLNSMYDDTHTM